MLFALGVTPGCPLYDLVASTFMDSRGVLEPPPGECYSDANYAGRGLVSMLAWGDDLEGMQLPELSRA